MASASLDLTETHILGSETRSLAVCAESDGLADWLDGSPACRLLKPQRIVHAGIMEARPPFKVVRPDQSGTFFLACFGGSGSILSDGGWKAVKAGTACLLPPHTVNALKVGRSKRWSFAWVRYLEPRGVVPVATAQSPSRGEFDPEPIKCAIEGLRAEVSREIESVAIQHHWVELIHGYVGRFAMPMNTDERVWKAWERVEAALGMEWTLDSIAAIASMSAENLRKLCQKALGRSPMKHLTYLRMRMAAEMLTTTDDKVETVARSVGYDNPFAFSNTFLKWIGVRPSEHRAEGKRGE
ncbi:MAG: helix-turn-helix transcriptional regulator [Verrucomicrobiales bacterium]|nr:helix-turn-helix transcriptional regulator [Verrucomicrobiales bacterium]